MHCTRLDHVFSSTQRVAGEQLLAARSLTKIVVRFPDPRQPARHYAARQWISATDSIQVPHDRLGGLVYCHDYQTVEAVEARVAADPRLATHLLASMFDPIPARSCVLTIYLMFSDEFMVRACRLGNLGWSRRMWSMSSRASLIGFTSVFYSVLGGAYSSLSKANANYAYKAGSLAVQQIKLAQWLKDPVLESKCWLYFAEDLIQLRRLRRADKIIARQWRFAQSLQDPILLTMCESVQAKRAVASDGSACAK